MTLNAMDVQAALARWFAVSSANLRLINHSENHTFAVETQDGRRYALRVHRPHYQSRITIESELAWLAALQRDTTLPLPQPIAGLDGLLLQRFPTAQGERLAVLFAFIAGDEPQPTSNLADLFITLGGYAATLHDHAINWDQPLGFKRQVWQADSILKPDGLWGDWRVAPGVDASLRVLLEQLTARLTQRLADYGTSAQRYGLIHADMRLGNLLVAGDRVSLIDFDDAGFCWFAYDFAAAISFHETNPAVPALKASWLDGYQAVRALDQEDVDILDTMILLRRMALLAWIGSHAETRLAKTHMPGFADGTAMLAERYLAGKPL